jgi:transcriptional regulator with XRE-family HTH domain
VANKLKKYRLKAGLVQVALAEKLGVSQPNYQRWEAGQVAIPKAMLTLLASVLDATPDALLGKEPHLEAHAYNDDAPDELNWYGEVSIHFAGGGEALLLSISEAARADLYSGLLDSREFILFQSLANQTVVLRKGAVSDLYFSSEAHDDYGPEHGTYNENWTHQIADPRDWAIIEACMDDMWLEEFDPGDVDRVKSMLETTTDERFAELVAKGHLQECDIPVHKARNEKIRESLFELSSQLRYQLSDGKIRTTDDFDERKICRVLAELTDEGFGEAELFVVLPTVGYHRTIAINKKNLDYITIPTHKWDHGKTQYRAGLLDGDDDDDDELGG